MKKIRLIAAIASILSLPLSVLEAKSPTPEPRSPAKSAPANTTTAPPTVPPSQPPPETEYDREQAKKAIKALVKNPENDGAALTKEEVDSITNEVIQGWADKFGEAYNADDIEQRAAFQSVVQNRIAQRQIEKQNTASETKNKAIRKLDGDLAAANDDKKDLDKRRAALLAIMQENNRTMSKSLKTPAPVPAPSSTNTQNADGSNVAATTNKPESKQP